jgi:hypothetical protein
MSVIERWTIWPTFVLPGSGEPACVIEGPTVPPRETVEVVRASGYEGAVSALIEVERILRAIDAQYVAMKYLPTTEPRAQILQALALAAYRGEQ